MNKIFTIGFTKKSAERFFTLLEDNNIWCVIDVRFNNMRQLAGFTKYPDIKYFLNRIANIDYVHDKNLAPSPEILTAYRNKQIDWAGYVDAFNKLMKSRNIINYVTEHYGSFADCCLMCSEEKPDFCHRRILAELLSEQVEELEIIHLI